jgi:hypothetical protein
MHPVSNPDTQDQHCGRKTQLQRGYPPIPDLWLLRTSVRFQHEIEPGPLVPARLSRRNIIEPGPQTLQFRQFHAARFAGFEVLRDLSLLGFRNPVDYIIRKLFTDFFTLHGGFSLESLKKISRNSFMAR